MLSEAMFLELDTSCFLIWVKNVEIADSFETRPINLGTEVANSEKGAKSARRDTNRVRLNLICPIHC